jgi:hypothetical protein
MNSENTIQLVKELEKISSSTKKNSYFGAWSGLLLGIVYLTYLFIKLSEGSVNIPWVYAFAFVAALLILLQSFYLIISTTMYRKVVLIIKSVLDLEKS